MSETGQVGRPTTDRGYQTAEAYTGDPDGLPLPDFSHRNYENTFIGWLMANQKDLYDTIIADQTTVSGIQLFPQYIEQDVTVPSNFDGITASRGVAVGYTVTVAPGSRLTHIGDTPIDTNLVQVTTNMTIENFSGYYSALLSDASKVKRNTGPAATFTVETVANVGWEVGDTLTIINQGTGDIIITAASGVTFDGNTTLGNNGLIGTMIMDSSDNWIITGETT